MVCFLLGVFSVYGHCLGSVSASDVLCQEEMAFLNYTTLEKEKEKNTFCISFSTFSVWHQQVH